ncbi:SDR family oxidoreductase [Microbacterium soli]|uniref:SDR family oxidoreductase n=1 Tax=Microbacterium soli TaxID=446075 RepID=A0ABP7MVI1_9MICO
MPNALITGGTSGIGAATAQLLHSRGYRVAVTGRNPETLARAREELPDGVIVVPADSASLSDTTQLMSVIEDRLGTLDLLFLNAGVFTPAPIADVTEESFDAQVGINFKGQYFTLQKALPLLNDGASVVLTVGIGSSRGAPGASVAAGTRGALLTMLPSLALELAPRRIRVNAVSPGAIDTPLFDKLGVPDEGREMMRSRIPFERFGTGEDIAGIVAFLGSDEARYITGQEIVGAGGYGLSA